jgi:hypothetical protein
MSDVDWTTPEEWGDSLRRRDDYIKAALGKMRRKNTIKDKQIMKYQKTWRTATPRKEIMVLRRQIAGLNERGLTFITPPVLCDFCTEFWATTYLEGDSDYGCNAGVEDDNFHDWAKTRCKSFKAHDNINGMIKARLVQALWTSLNKAAPHEKTITELKKEIELLDKLFKEKLEQINQLARQQNMLEVLARIREGKNESGNATGSSPP